MPQITSLSIIVAGIALAAPSYAQVPAALAEEILQCTALQQDAERLSCFDRIARKIAPPPPVADAPEIVVPTEAVSAAPAAAVAATAAVLPDAMPDVASAQVADSAVETMPQNDVPSADALSGEEIALGEFGMNADLASKQPDRKPEEPLREISAKVVEVYKRGYGEHVVTLDNGQVWTETRNEDGLRISVGDTVRIKRSTFGGYRIVGTGNRSSPAKRIE